MDDTLVHATKEETDTLFHRVRCAVNTPQLAVNSATREDKAQGLLATLNTVVNVFRRYCPWTKRVKELCGKDVIAQVEAHDGIPSSLHEFG